MTVDFAAIDTFCEEMSREDLLENIKLACAEGLRVRCGDMAEQDIEVLRVMLEEAGK